MEQHYKFPRTYHLDTSPGLQSDDKRYEDLNYFNGKEVIATIKMDGENTTIYRNYIHARSIDSPDHPSRSWVKQLQSKIGYNLPENYRIAGENLFAEHSISYQHLKDYFQVFAIFDQDNNNLSWDELITWSQLLDLKTVDSFYRGPWDQKLIHSLFEAYQKTAKDTCEGYVIRVANTFHYNEYTQNVVKWVREGHVQPDTKHWRTAPIIQNKLGE